MITCCDREEFIELITDKRILIYGAGYVALNFWEALKRNGLEEQIRGFVVSQIAETQKYIGALPVQSIDQAAVDDETIVCIAVHEALEEEIEAALLQKGISNYIWIYPFLYNLYLGNPVKEGEWIDTKEFIRGYEQRYGLAVRWAAIDDYYGKCPGGLDLYKKAMAMHGSMDTIKARTDRFLNLIQDWGSIGYDDRWQIAIDRNYEIIDGEHRVALALYHGQPQMRCRIYDGKSMHGDKVLMTKKALFDGGFTIGEIEILDKINLYIKHTVLEEKKC